MFWRKQGSGLTHVSNDKYYSSPQLSMQQEICKKLHLRCEHCGSESDLDSPDLWFITSRMRRVMYNVCSTVQCTLSARICQDQVYFMPLCHATFTLAFCMIQNRKMFRLLIFRMTVLLAQSLLWVVRLISINRIWSLVIGPGFYSANKI